MLRVFSVNRSIALFIFWLMVTSEIYAQETNPPPEMNRDIVQRFGVAGGIGKMTPGRWGLMKSTVSNPSDRDREVLSVVYFDNDPGVQFGRRVWIPANSNRVVWIPVLIPEDIITDEELRGEYVTAKANVMLLDQSGDKERVLTEDWQQLSVRSNFFVDNSGQPITVSISDEPSPSGLLIGGLNEAQINDETLRSMRLARGLKNTVSSLNDPRAPVVPALLESADQLIVRGNRLATDAPGRTAIRQWVQQGGRLWVMLDSMEEETCRRLLGDSFDIEFVDRLGLVSFQSEIPEAFQTPERNRRFGSRRGDTAAQEHEHPVDFVRTVVDDCEIMATIDGWPSIFKKSFGRGTIVFTTVGPRALSRAKRTGERIRGMEGAKLVPRPELELIADVLFAKRNSPPISNSTLIPLIERGIGYQVPGRGMVLSILFGFCVSLTLVGSWLSKKGKLGHLIWIAPVASLLATIPLIAVANATQQEIPPTVVEAQYIEVTPSGDDLFVQGLTGVFDNQVRSREFAANMTSVFIPDRSGISGVWRMVWSDIDQCQWENVSMPSGIRQVPFSTTLHSSAPFRAYGTFGPQGFTGKIETPVANVRDAIVASSTRVSLAVSVDQGVITQAKGGTLDPGNYIASGMLSDEQICHQQVYRNLMDLDEDTRVRVVAAQKDSNNEATGDEKAAQGLNGKFLDRPSLMVWTDSLALGYQFGDDMQKKGSALVVMPIELGRPKRGQTIRIPSVFLSYDSVRGPKNEGVSVAYNSELGIWPKQSVGTKSTLRFQIPKIALPFRPLEARLRVKVSAPNRTISVQSGAVDSLVPNGNPQEAMGELTYRFTDPQSLVLDENGGLHVRIEIGKLKVGNATAHKDEWKIEFVDLELEGTYLPDEK